MRQFTILILAVTTLLACRNNNTGNSNAGYTNSPTTAADTNQPAFPTPFLGNPTRQPSTQQKKVGVVLGGGGAKAAAEIGVLKEIENFGIKVDAIASTSMGSFVGCLYAAGFSAREIEDIWHNEEWVKLIDNGTDYSSNERNFIGVIQGEEFEDHLRRLLATRNCTTFEETEIPFVCTATEVIDKHHLREEHFHSGDLARAVRASLAFPFPIAGYNPVEHNGKKYVDGGMFNNFPVDIVENMNVEQIIAIDLETSNNNMHFTPEIEALSHVLPWLANWALERPDTERHKQNKEKARNRYIYINPGLKGYSILDFSRKKAEQLIVQGASAFKKEKNRIMRLLDL